MQTRIRTLITLVVLAIAVLVSACTPTARAEIASITIRGGDHHFVAPSELAAGLVSLTFENVGKELHHLQLVALNDGVTNEEAMAALANGPEALFPLLKGFPGGVAPIEPGASGRVTVKLEAGNYLLLCFLSDKEGVPHIAHGMVAPLIVTGEFPSDLEAPATTGEVQLLDFSFVLPQAIKAGKQTWQITNKGTQPHEIVLLKLVEGKTMADFIAYEHKPEGPPPYVAVGGFQGINPGASGWLHLDLTPGDYIAVCHIPDAASGKSHNELGMQLPFQVK